MIYFDKRNIQSGFTLIETFVAVLILVFAVIGPLGLLSRAINDGNYAKNQITAYYLAQEAVDLVINQRDSNLSASPAYPWNNGLSSCWGDTCAIGLNLSQNITTKTCDIDSDSVGNGCRLYVVSDGATNYYSIEGPSDQASLFKREVSIRETVTNEAIVTVRVRWINKTQPVDFELATTIYNQGYLGPITP